ncbi:hypothetical protein [Alteromonas sp. a30]|uniref:hypothetical protein n=1 Tax=Alteromonas sp. a30 TaxID=2730917 RepID=UPI0022815200|nr:hypothetical protein [Alteromonas sp. a30]MCY7295837.1 hypothetical protein [Alteromonas sp. a30]
MKTSILRIFTGLLALLSFQSFAHVRWFVPVGTELPKMSLPMDWIAALILFGGAGFVVSVLVIAKIGQSSQRFGNALFNQWNDKHNIGWYILFGLVNLLFLHNLLLGEFLGPHFFISHERIIVGVVLQSLVLIGSVISLAFTGLVLFAIALVSLLFFSFESGIDYFFEMASLGLAYFFISTRISQFDRGMFARFGLDKLKHYAPIVLRIGLGVQLLTLAIHNKFYEPAATYFFLEEHPYYNFPNFFGWEDFTHLHFALAAGTFESLFGIMLTLGLATRYVLLVIAFFFASTGVISGLDELMGHLPIFGFVAVLLVYGDTGFGLKKSDEAHDAMPAAA